MISLEETKRMLEDLKYARKAAIRYKANLAEVMSDCITLKSSLALINEIRAMGGVKTSTVEKAGDRIAEARNRYEEQLIKVFELEDKVALAMQDLTNEEREIIAEYYLKDRTHYQIAMEFNYSERTVRYIKTKALEKIARKL